MFSVSTIGPELESAEFKAIIMLQSGKISANQFLLNIFIKNSFEDFYLLRVAHFKAYFIYMYSTMLMNRYTSNPINVGNKYFSSTEVYAVS